ncbi:drug/metabolite transporter (DMT)-like permease [Psychromicrobium silvestre]|uniref:Drug/metabolite transporter (DMT)-like permease n=1 Tax=Psychromicrobium silvestre TaxID=1645614 RepID=A0A7Y9LTL8_9MICC|nr:DMT family transporter [Psychromicrobium silvestre]NYE95424.1 drug/metabolite transporter (DMT)-like permease [Psychromicrobium silvestre]
MTPPREQRTWSSTRVDVLLLCVALVWGSSYLAAKQLTEQASVPAVLSIRFGIAALALLPLWWWKTRKLPSRAELIVGTILGLSQASVLLLETYGVAGTSATNAGLIISLTVIFTPLLESASNRAWLPPSFFIAATLAVVGVALLVSGNGFRAPNLGDLLMLGAAGVRAFHVTLMGRLTQRKPFSSFSITLIQTVVCVLVFSALDPSGLGSAIQNFQLPQWLGALYLGLACSVFAFLVQLWAIRQTSPSRASLLMGTEPVWAVLIGVTLGGELLGWLGAAGAALIIGATYAGQRIETASRLRRAAKQRTENAPAEPSIPAV